MGSELQTSARPPDLDHGVTSDVMNTILRVLVALFAGLLTTTPVPSSVASPWGAAVWTSGEVETATEGLDVIACLYLIAPWNGMHGMVGLMRQLSEAEGLCLRELAPL